jgi:ribosomal protein S18 acetylase RimI-like enzyme
LIIPEIEITEVLPEDLLTLQEISRQTFQQSFAAMNTEENMKYFLEHHYSEGKLLSEILNPDSRFFFAKNKNRVIGYLKINRNSAQTVLPNDDGLEIERIYIDETLKGFGMGGLLIAKAIDSAKKIKASYIWLGVWEHNKRAIRFYEKNGFIPYSSHIFKLGDDEQTDLLLKMTLKE